MLEQVLSFKDARKLLGMSEPWLRKQISAKKIPHYKIGRCVKFKASELEEYIKSRKVA
ncbi:MAG: helix-turn-helix domain-containing protein [Acidobacteria bacterium]|nr:helix-turn-helix domain-containing protein [Acidobacteriota bacterium]